MKYKIAGIILAGGYSLRMGQLKALLPIGGKIAVNKQIDCYKNAGIEDVFVVGGYNAEKIFSAIRGDDIKTVYNPDFDKGMYSSLCAGVSALLDGGYEGFFFLPVDHILVRPYMIKLLIKAFDENPHKIIYPVSEDRKGHPPLLPICMAEKILKFDGDGGAKNLLKKYESRQRLVPIASDEISIDMDTPEDYYKVLCRYEDSVPSEEECYDILAAEDVPKNIVKHCAAVAKTALQLSARITDKRILLDDRLICASALLHDICKLEENHARAGANLLKANGYPRVAEIVGNHMELSLKYAGKISEASVVYLADKLVKEDKQISLQERIAAVPPENRQFAEQRLKTALEIQKLIDLISGN